MTQEKTLDGLKNDRRVDLVEFSVVLVANSNNPTIINPDFLLHNEIVNADLSLQGDPITTPLFSQVVFEGGIAVVATPDRVIFQQTGDPLALKDILCPKIAERYLKKVPHVPYSAVGINPKGYRQLPAERQEKVSDVLINKGAWMSFKDVVPEVYLKTIYQYDKRTIVLDIAEGKKRENDDIEIPGLLFQVNIHRDIPPTTNQQDRIKTISDILALWKQDLSDFDALVKKFNFKEFTS